AIVERGEAELQRLDKTSRQTAREQAERLYKALDALNDVSPSNDSQARVDAAIATLRKDILPGELREVAIAARERIFGEKPSDELYFKGAVPLFRHLRAIIEQPGTP